MKRRKQLNKVGNKFRQMCKDEVLKYSILSLTAGIIIGAILTNNKK